MIDCLNPKDPENQFLIANYGENMAYYIHHNIDTTSKEQIQYLVGGSHNFIATELGINVDGIGQINFPDGRVTIGNKTFVKNKLTDEGVRQIIQEINIELRNNGQSYVKDKYGFDKLITKPYITNNLVNFEKIVSETDTLVLKDLQKTVENSIPNFTESSIEQEKAYRIEIKDEEGNHNGFFSSTMQKEVVDSIFAYVVGITISKNEDIQDMSDITIGEALTRIENEFVDIANEESKLDITNVEEASKWANAVLDSWPDFVLKLKDKFKKYGLSVGDYEFETDDNYDSPQEDDSSGGDGFKNNYLLENVEIDPRDTLSKRVKLFMSFIPDTTVIGTGDTKKLVTKKNLFGFSKLYNVDKLYQELLHQFANKPNVTFAEIKQELEAQKFSKPIFGKLLEYLNKNTDIQIEKELVTSLRKVNITAYLTTLERDNSGNAVFRTFEENRNSFEKTLITKWQENQKLGTELIKINENKEYSIDGKRVVEYRNRFNEILLARKDKKDSSILEDKLAKMMLADLGITLTNEAYNELKSGLQFLGKDTKYKKAFNLQFNFTKDGAADGLFSSLLEDLEGSSKAGESQDEDLEYDINRNNPLYFSNDNIKTLARVESRHNLEVVTKGHITLEGKQVFDFSNASYEWREILKLNEIENRQKIEADLFGSQAPFYSEIWQNDSRRKNYHPGTVAGLKNNNSKQEKGKTPGNQSNRERFINTIAQYINQDKDTGIFVDLTKSDKKIAPAHSGVYKQKLRKDDYGGAIKFFNKAIQAEFDRIKFVQSSEDEINIDALKKGGKNFYFVHLLNEEYATAILEKYQDANIENIWKDGLLNNEVTVNTKEVKLILDEFIQSLYAKTKIEYDSLNISSKDILDQFDTSKQALATDINKLRLEADTADKLSIAKGDKIREQIKEKAAQLEYLNSQAKVEDTLFEWSINQYLFNVTLSMLFSGDPALFYKTGSNIDETLRKTYAEYGKRQAKDLAPGSSIEHSKENYSSLVAKVNKSSIDYLKGFDILKKAYSSVDTTDAIQYATVSRYVQLQYDRGRVSKDIYDSITRKVQQSKDNGSYTYDLTEEELKGLLLGPEKPVEVSKQNIAHLINGKNYSYINYIKSALFPLVPMNTQNFEIDKVRVMIEKNNIDQLYMTTAGKAGNVSEPLELVDKDGKFIDHPVEKIEKSTNRLMKSEGLLFQQEIPFDEEKEKITFITQLNKLITDTIARIDKPVFNGLTGLEISLQKESIRKQMIDLETTNFKNLLGITKTGKVDNKVVRNLLIEELNTPHEKQSLAIDESTGDFITPWLFNPFRESLESKLMTKIKRLIQPKMSGKSFVQASALGITSINDSGKIPPNIIATQSYNGEKLKMPRPVVKEIYEATGEEQYLTQEELDKVKEGKGFRRGNTNYTGLMLPAQVLVPFQFFHTDEDGVKNKLDIRNYLDENGKIDNNKLPKELLRLVGARIPNQSHSSQLPIEIVGFLPTSMGDTIYVPDGITAQMGSDFDVDKLYVYKPNYIPYEDIETGSAIYEYQNEEVTLKGLQNQYFDTLYTILNSPAMFEKVVKPLDMADLGEVAAKLNKDKRYSTYHSVTTQLSDYLSNKDAKAGVGFSSLQLTFNSLLQRTENVDLAYRKVVKGVLVDIPQFTIKLGDLELNTFSGLGNSVYTDNEGNDYYRTTSDNIIQAQSAFVDHAKERLVDQINLNSDTSPAWFALIQLKDKRKESQKRDAINVDVPTRMVNSPVVRDYINLMNQEKDEFSKGFRGNLREKIIKELASKYQFNTFEIPALFTKGAFELSQEDIGVDQGGTLKLFLILNEVGSELFQTINAFNVDTKGAGTSITESINKKDRLDEVRTTYTYIKNRTELLEYPESYQLTDNQTEIAKVEEATTEFVNKYLAQSFGYRNLDRVFRAMAYNKGSILSLKQQKQIIGEYTKFVFSSSSMDYFDNPQAVRNRLIYGNNSLAHRLQNMKFKYPNFIFRKLQSKIAKKEGEPSYITYDTNEKELDKDLIFSDFFELSKSDNPEIKSFINDLLLYNYVVQGNRNSPSSFTQLIPPALLNHNSYLQLISKGLEINTDRFVRQLSQHKPNMLQSVNLKGNPSKQTHIQVSKDQLQNQPQFIYAQFEGQQYVYEYWNDQDQVLNYFQIGKLGDRYGSEYDFESEFPISAIPKNLVSKVINRGQLEAIAFTEPIGEDNVANIIKSTLDKTLQAVIETQGVKKESVILAQMYKEILDSEVIPLEVAKTTSAYFVETHNLDIKPTKDLNSTVENILHETAHAFTSRTIKLYREQPDLIPSEKVGKAIENLEALRKYTIDKLYKAEYYPILKAIQEARNLTEDEYIDQVQSALTQYPEARKLIYGTQNIEEFLTLAMTNREFQEQLNGLRDKTGKKTLLESLKNWFSEFLTAIKNSYGVKIRADSVLNSAINNAFAIIEEYPDLRATLEKTYKQKQNNIEEFNSLFDDEQLDQIDYNLQQSGRVTYTCKT